jgi:hypothetical protein
MGATAAISYLSNHFLGNPIPAAGIRNKVMQTGRAFKDQLAAATSPPVIPTPPSTATNNSDAAIAAASAASIARRRAANAGGFASTILTPPTIGQAPTARKQLLGQ